MTSETIPPNKWTGKKKHGEVFRLQRFMSEKKLKPIDIQNDTGVSVRTVTNSIYEENPLGSKFLRELHAKYGVSIDWIVSGVGSMLLHDEPFINEDSPADYLGIKTNAGASSINRTARDQRLLGFISEWLTYAGDDEKAWLEMELKFNLVQYQRYLEDLDNDE